jgi:hypothetical protein
MGYSINMIDANLRIHEKYAEDCVKALKNFVCSVANPVDLPWITPNYVFQAADIIEVFEELRWEFQLEGDYYVLKSFTGHKSGADFLLWKKVAPFVEDNSSITMEGEDDVTWMWEFYGGKVDENYDNI